MPPPQVSCVRQALLLSPDVLDPAGAAASPRTSGHPGKPLTSGSRIGEFQPVKVVTGEPPSSWPHCSHDECDFRSAGRPRRCCVRLALVLVWCWAWDWRWMIAPVEGQVLPLSCKDPNTEVISPPFTRPNSPSPAPNDRPQSGRFGQRTASENAPKCQTGDRHRGDSPRPRTCDDESAAKPSPSPLPERDVQFTAIGIDGGHESDGPGLRG